jgi:hypothetical protein
VEAIHALAGVMEDKNAAKGVLVTTSWVGKASRDFAARSGSSASRASATSPAPAGRITPHNQKSQSAVLLAGPGATTHLISDGLQHG